MEDLLAWDARCPSVPRRLPLGTEQVNSPLSWQEWDRCLASHPDQRFRRYIVDGIRRGFRIGFDYSHADYTRSSPNNMISARDHPEVVGEYLAAECGAGRVLGPFDPARFPLVHTSRFGVIPKGSSGKWRLIVDMSSPEGASINDGITESLASLSYVGVDDAAEGVVSYGRGALLAKVDVRSAYRNVPVHPDDWWLMGMLWEGSLYVDTALPFGLRSAPKIFTAIADAAEWIARQEGIRSVIHYLDDFLVLGAPASEECAVALRKLLSVFGRLGLPVAEEKLDSGTLEIRLPPRKLNELQQLLQLWVGRKSCTRKELESLTGKLAHASRAVRPGKTFMGRMFQLLGGAHRAHHHIRLNLSFRSDLQWWCSFIASWNGVGMMKPQRGTQHTIHFWTDASGQFGCGALEPHSQEWIQLQWPHTYAREWVRLKEESIALKELLPIVLACAVWGEGWKNRAVTVHCDNLGVVALVNSGYSRVPQIMHLLRCLFFIRARFHLDVWAVHVPGVQNTLADAISRNNIHLFLSQMTGAAGRRKSIPPDLLSLLVGQQPDWTSPAWTRLFANSFPPV